ncbi:DUF3472 domain-containing protein [Snuella sedimenti]|uniref:DUF5077 domain-containing protein n=1 Tax=Snuella sedimenti TaxID=2798802 RepID=A0A8J7J5A0_9FLAO|nr:DUF5077 domain-containing protein [Snuella sedimenti]MBJ6368948.1 DUF5077 domain-containing protein [Snuella sedimenti]
MKTIKLVLLVCISSLLCNYSCDKDETLNESEDMIAVNAGGPPPANSLSISVPCEGNSWVVDNPTATDNIIVSGGIKNWTSSSDKIRTYFYAKATGSIELGIKAKFAGNTTLKVTFDGVSQEKTFSSSNNFKKHYIGSVTINQVGYYYVELEGVTAGGGSFGEISDVLLGDNAWSSNITYVESDWFYWGRRGPSCHLGYEEPANKDITWFYNEVTVPVGMDPVGSYFMANGFSGGYFGMQVNSETDRHILFSVWSAYDTQDPNQIPAEYTVIPLGYGDGVTVGEFGGEGSGAQSYLNFPWVAGNTYKFLLKGESNVANSTDYTAYFYAPEVGEWKLIASFRKPYSSGPHLTTLYSFIENFHTTMGDETRLANYANQWVYDTQGNWYEMTTAQLGVDSTASNDVRFDYDGGVSSTSSNSFYLRNCGFFSDNGVPYSSHTRSANGVAPNINFSQLEVPSIPVHTEVDRSAWSVIDYSSQEDQGGEGSTGRAADVLDGNVNTYWHSCWSGCSAAPPHHITVDAGAAITVDGFRFVQRQSLNRTVKDIEIQVSNDNSNWQSLGDFVLAKTTANIDINLPSPATFRYFKFIAKVAHDGTNNASMAEISAYLIE